MDISKTEALAILNIQNEIEAEDAFESILFEWKKKYLSVIPALPLIDAHIKKITRLDLAARQFLVMDTFNNFNFSKIDETSTLIEYLKAYHPLIMSIKLQISTCESSSCLIAILKELKIVQFNLLKKLFSYSPKIDNTKLDLIKISSPSDFYQVQKELLEKEIYETEIMNYLRAELKNSQHPYSSFLLTEVLKAVKQVR